MILSRPLREFAPTEQSHRVAQEHYRWARQQGMSDELILHSIGLVSPAQPSPHTVIDSLRRTWLALQCGWSIEYQPGRAAE